MASRTRGSSLRAVAAAAAVLLLALAGSSAAAGPPFRACLVTGTGGIEDPAFAQLAADGLGAVDGTVLHGRSEAEYVAALRTCAAHAGLTIGVGYELATAVDLVAIAFPRASFAIVGVDVRTLPHRPANVTGLVFKEQEAGYLAGYTAGLWAKAQGGKAVGSIGGLDIPSVNRAVAGFRFGAKRADPGLTTSNRYSGDFTLRAACAKQALAQIAAGSVVEFEVAGSCGLGALAAARAKGTAGIAFGADHASLGPLLLTSALERADVAVGDAVQAARAGRLRGGVNMIFSARNRGVGYGTWSPLVPARIRRAVAAQYALLRAGKIKDIPTTVQ